MDDLGYWEVTLCDGQIVRVWAHGYQEVDGAYVFNVLADAEEEEQHGLVIMDRAPTDAKRVIVALCRFPVEAVTKVRSG